MKHTLIAIFMISLALASCGTSTDNTSAKTEATKPATAKITGLNEWLPTEYFTVMVKSARIVDGLSDKEMGELLKKEAGNKYIIIDISLKNTDKESRMMFDGELLADNSGTISKYEETETVMADGYGMVMDNINPGVTKNTKLVYKIPADFKGAIYYHPSRSDDNAKIQILNL